MPPPQNASTWRDGVGALKGQPLFEEYSRIQFPENDEQRGDLRKPATFQLMTVFAGSAKQEQ